VRRHDSDAGQPREENVSARIDINAIRREQVIEAVRRIIVRDGLDAVTIARIAAEADVSRGVVTYHFEHKEEILHDVLRAAMRDANEASETIRIERTAWDIASMAERVAQLADSENDWWRIYVAFLAQAQTSDFYRSELAWVNRHYAEALERIVGNRARAVAIVALLQGLAVQRLVDPDLPVQDVVPEIASLLQAWQGSLAPGDVVGSEP
jgi:AcrR family transcriptional regulator